MILHATPSPAFLLMEKPGLLGPVFTPLLYPFNRRLNQCASSSAAQAFARALVWLDEEDRLARQELRAKGWLLS